MKYLIILLSFVALNSVAMPPDSLMSYEIEASSARLDSIDLHLFNTFRVHEEDTFVWNGERLFSHITDSVLEERFKEMDKESPIHFHLTPSVKKEIKRFLNSSSKNMALWRGRAKFYFPIFEQALDKNKIPMEFKYIPVMESGLNPIAESRMGATGLWQFMYHTGKANGLTINSYLDERSEPAKSTHAAGKYINYLYDIYGDWLLALAAYNSGPGNVNKALRLGNGKWDYWAIQPYLPKETQGYIPRFIALNYLFKYYKEHNIRYIKPIYLSEQTKTLQIDRKMPLKFVSKILDLEMKHLTFLNPQYKIKIIPGSETKQYPLVIPVTKSGLWIDKNFELEELLAAYEKKHKIHYPKVKQVNEYYRRSGKRVTYTVKSGDVLGTIAQKFNTSVKKIKAWNRLRSNRIKVGKKLVIYK
ncbi:MAG: transglycosylase SLT domain-containing protein [Flavobacteriales bacterium]|jgi:membrane-bound lytic murein transglycosylase D|nr:transglycosylase SLT domain-containing protein [Flavobacteriales bacterium]